MACADELLAASARDVATRPRALFLTGDQIYADDVAGPLVAHLRQLAERAHGAGGRALDARVSAAVAGPRQRAARARRRPRAADRAEGRRPPPELRRVRGDVRDGLERTDLAPAAAPGGPDLDGGRSPRALRARRKYDQQLRNLERARRALPAARRVLANVPTYMIFDDHDVTDDWNLTREWRERWRRARPGGGWSRTRSPRTGSSRAGATTRTATTRLSRAPSPRSCAPTARVSEAEFEERLWSFDRWSYVAPTTPPTVVLDTRTQRSYDSARGAARLLGPAERRRAAELARRARAIGGGDPHRPLVIVSAVPVYGLELQERRQKFLADKVGPYEIDFEAWHSNLQGLVDFMRMLAEEPAPPWCLLLSGDVHYGCNVQAAFWTGGRGAAARAAGLQLVQALGHGQPDGARAVGPGRVAPARARRLGPAARPSAAGWPHACSPRRRTRTPGTATPRSSSRPCSPARSASSDRPTTAKRAAMSPPPAMPPDRCSSAPTMSGRSRSATAKSPTACSRARASGTRVRAATMETGSHGARSPEAAARRGPGGAPGRIAQGRAISRSSAPRAPTG